MSVVPVSGWCPLTRQIVAKLGDAAAVSLLRLADDEQRLDGPALVHGGVGVSDVVEVGRVVEDKTGVDASGEDVVEQLGDVPACGRDAALDADVLPEQRLVLELLVQRDADGADHASRADDAGAGLDGLVGTDALQCGVDAGTVGEAQDGPDGVVTAILDDVGGPELLGDGLPRG